MKEENYDQQYEERDNTAPQYEDETGTEMELGYEMETDTGAIELDDQSYGFQESAPGDESIGGWLAVFLFLGVGGGVILSLASTLPELSNPLIPGDISAWGYGYMLCFALLGLMTIIQFFRRSKDAVSLAKNFTILVFLDGLAGIFIGDWGSIRSVIWSLIWFAFLCSSTKVERMFPPEYRKASWISWTLLTVGAIMLIGFFYKIHSLLALANYLP